MDLEIEEEAEEQEDAVDAISEVSVEDSVEAEDEVEVRDNKNKDEDGEEQKLYDNVFVFKVEGNHWEAHKPQTHDHFWLL